MMLMLRLLLVLSASLGAYMSIFSNAFDGSGSLRTLGGVVLFVVFPTFALILRVLREPNPRNNKSVKRYDLVGKRKVTVKDYPFKNMWIVGGVLFALGLVLHVSAQSSRGLDSIGSESLGILFIGAGSLFVVIDELRERPSKWLDRIAKREKIKQSQNDKYPGKFLAWWAKMSYAKKIKLLLVIFFATVLLTLLVD